MFDTSAPDWFYEEGYTGDDDSSMRLENENRQTTKSYTANTTDAGGWANGFADNGARPAPPQERTDTGVNRSVYSYNGKTFSAPMNNGASARNAGAGYTSPAADKTANTALGLAVLSFFMFSASVLSFMLAVIAVILAKKALKTGKNNSKAKAAKVLGTLMIFIEAGMFIYWLALNVLM